jgi:hypothetical protein
MDGYVRLDEEQNRNQLLREGQKILAPCSFSEEQGLTHRESRSKPPSFPRPAACAQLSISYRHVWRLWTLMEPVREFQVAYYYHIQAQKETGSLVVTRALYWDLYI